jgi:hypothetical protein
MSHLHTLTFEYLTPTQEQIQNMAEMRLIAQEYADKIDFTLHDGPDKTYILRKLREVAMWVNVSLTRYADGTPRTEPVLSPKV